MDRCKRRSRICSILVGTGLSLGACSGGAPSEIERGAESLLAGPLAGPELSAWVYIPANPTTILATWTTVPGATGYAIDRQVNGSGAWKQVAVNGADDTAHIDSNVKPTNGYCYRIRPLPSKVAGTSNVACDIIPTVFQAESLARTQSQGTTRMIYGDEPSKGSSFEMDLGENGWVEFQIPIAKTGVYELLLNHEIGPTMGTWDVLLDGKRVGEVGAYFGEGWVGYEGPSFGDFEVTTAPSVKTLRLQVTGKDASSTGYVIGLDTIALRPSGLGRFEAKKMPGTVSQGDRLQISADPLASNGKLAIAHLNAVGDFVEFAVPVLVPGDYLVAMRFRRGQDSGEFKTLLDGAELPDGRIDAYAATPSFSGGPLSSLHIATAGNHLFRFVVTGKNSASNGYDLALDFIDLLRAPDKICLGKATGEACSDLNKCTLGDTCNHGTCTAGQEVVQCPSSEQCVSGGYCDSDTGLCVEPSVCSTCGNGVIEYNEECDDGNLVDGDGCQANCKLTPLMCGDGIVERIPESSAMAVVLITYLARNCDTAQGNAYLILNGIELGRAPLPLTCSCEPGIRSISASGPSMLAALRPGWNYLEMRAEGDVAWGIGQFNLNDGSGTAAPLIQEGEALSNRDPNLCEAGTVAWPVGGMAFDYLPSEECDDGNTVDNDACSNRCTLN